MAWKDRFRRIRTIDAHTAGEPLRLVVEGAPPLEGRTILEKRAFMKRHHDGFRTALMFEPRGHADMYGAILTEPATEDGDYGVLFLHNEGYSTMCGHGIIALATILFETGMHTPQGEETIIRFDTPAGRVSATARFAHGRVESVSFLNVPSFAYSHGLRVGGGHFDVAFGGAFYAIGEAAALGLRLDPPGSGELIRKGREIKLELAAANLLNHSSASDLGFLYGVIFTGPPENPSHHSRNVCVFADGEVDRSPTGTGVSARAALHFASREIGLFEPIVIESILGTSFTVEVVEEVKFGEHDAIIPKVTGSAFLTGEHEFLIAPEDPLAEGFLVR